MTKLVLKQILGHPQWLRQNLFLDICIIFTGVYIVFICFNFLHVSHNFFLLAIDFSKLLDFYPIKKSVICLLYVGFILLWGELLACMGLSKRQYLLDAIQGKSGYHICPKLAQFINKKIFRQKVFLKKP